MKSGYFESFKSFVKGHGQSVLFTALFYSLWIVSALLFGHDFTLKSFPNRMIGISTLDAYDVGGRVSLFYKCVAVFFASFTGFNLLAYFISLKKETLLNSVETRIVNYSSLAGILFCLFQAFEYKMPDSIEIIYFLHKLMLAGMLVRGIFFKNNSLTVSNYSIIVSLATAVYFFVADCVNLAGYARNPDFLIVTFVIACILIIGLNMFLKNSKSTKKETFLAVLASALVPVLLLPLVSIFKDEVFFILRSNRIVLNSLVPVYVCLIVFLAAWIIWRYKRTANSAVIKSQSDLLALRYFPLLIFSLASYFYYSYFMEYSNEMFESGNKYLPIMEFMKFGVIPTLEKSNSHLLSDYFFSAVYTLLNGLQGTEMELYDFIHASLCWLLYYYLVYFVSRSPYIAFFTVLFFPLYSQMMPDGHGFGIIALFAINKLLTSASTLKNYIVFFATVTFITLWRIDLGYTCILVSPIVLLYYHFSSHPFRINWLNLAKAFGIVMLALATLLTALSVYRHVNLFDRALYSLNYFMSAQTYGYYTLGWNSLPGYKMQYSVFPVMVCLVVLALAFNFKRLNKSKSSQLAYLALLFMCLYYFANFNRGLVRHSLIESTDSFVASFVYVIIPGTIFVFFRKQKLAFRYAATMVVALVVLTSYKLPDPKGSKSIFEDCFDKISETRNRNLSKIKSRIKNAPEKPDETNKGFFDFIKNNTKADETFIDFTNNPMLYFYSQKITPSVFYQNPLCSHNEFLQKRFVKDLGDYKVPFLVFSVMNGADYDLIDGVPNTLRHYRMAEYFYNNYEPYIQEGKYCIWKQKDTRDANKINTVYHFRKGLNETLDTIRRGLAPGTANKKYVVKIVSNDLRKVDLKVLYNRARVRPFNYQINDSTLYFTMEPLRNYCELVIANNDCLREFKVMDCTYFPDYRTQQYFSYNFKQLPHIWGTYDEKLPDEPVLFEKNINEEFGKDSACVVRLPAKIDKHSGNTLIITCLNKSQNKAPQKLILLFGNSEGTKRTSITMDIIKSDREEKYAVRVSSIYKWYMNEVDEITLKPERPQDIKISKIQVTKGS